MKTLLWVTVFASVAMFAQAKPVLPLGPSLSQRDPLLQNPMHVEPTKPLDEQTTPKHADDPSSKPGLLSA